MNTITTIFLILLLTILISCCMIVLTGLILGLAYIFLLMPWLLIPLLLVIIPVSIIKHKRNIENLKNRSH